MEREAACEEPMDIPASIPTRKKASLPSSTIGPNNNHNPDAQRQHNGPLRAYPVGHETKITEPAMAVVCTSRKNTINSDVVK